MMKKTLLFIFGTRPEAIKLAPLILNAKENPLFECKVCITSQHNEMLQDVLTLFNITADYNLDIMSHNQSLSNITEKVISGLDPILKSISPDMAIVQGDTSTTFSAALSAFYNKIPIAHVEAGLRTYNHHPFPEEMNRTLTSRLASIHFPPTQSAENALLAEGISTNIFTVGNTVIDALFLGLEKLNKQPQLIEHISTPSNKKHILVTCHRRENIGQPLINVCQALNELSNQHDDIHITFPVHLNPNIKSIINEHLQTHPNITLAKPASYPEIIHLMKLSHIILTDSGGIQEEASSLGTPTLVLRNITERTEGIKQQQAIITGTDTKKILKETNQLLQYPSQHQKMANPSTVYGDGNSSIKILTHITHFLNESPTSVQAQ